jgi:hypothetical protein
MSKVTTILDERELATTLAALRACQLAAKLNRGSLTEQSPDHFIDVPVLTDEEIDELCEKLNCSGDISSDLSAVLDAADAYSEDLTSGKEEGLYEQGDPESLDKAIAKVKAWLRPEEPEPVLFDKGKPEPPPTVLPKVITETPYIWLDDGEAEGTAECGCRLVQEQGTSGSAIFLCPVHREAPDLFAAAERSLRIAQAWQADEREKFFHDDDNPPVRGQHIEYDAATQEVEYLEAIIANCGGSSQQCRSCRNCGRQFLCDAPGLCPDCKKQQPSRA